VGGQTTLIDPTLEKVGGQLTPLTPCFRSLWPMGNPMVTWRNRSRGHRIPHRLFPIGGSLKPSLYV